MGDAETGRANGAVLWDRVGGAKKDVGDWT